VTAARDEVLARVRAANGAASRTARGHVGTGQVQRGYRTAGDHPPGSPQVLDLFADRLLDYAATVARCGTEGLRDAVADALRAAAPPGGRVLLAPGLPDTWAPAGARDDGTAPAAELDGYAAVVTACRAACAETGTIVLDGAPDQGRRAITLVPDVHVCVVRAEQVVQTVPELLARVDGTRPVTLISGPSATSDIELDRVEGVHGPRTLSVVLLSGNTA
jgi:L-lactate dehydrogenase complex protein LldG